MVTLFVLGFVCCTTLNFRGATAAAATLLLSFAEESAAISVSEEAICVEAAATSAYFRVGIGWWRLGHILF